MNDLMPFYYNIFQSNLYYSLPLQIKSVVEVTLENIVIKGHQVIHK